MPKKRPKRALSSTSGDASESPAKKLSVLGSIIGGAGDASLSFLSGGCGGLGHQSGSELERARTLLCQGGADAESEAVELLEAFVANAKGKQAAPGVLAMFSPQRLHAEALVELGKLRVGRGDVEGAVEHFTQAFGLAQVAESYLWAAKALRQSAPSQEALQRVRCLLQTAVEIGGDKAACSADAECAVEAREALALLLYQAGETEEAHAHLHQLGYKYSLARHVLSYRQGGACDGVGSRDYLRVVDRALPPKMLRHMQEAFAEGSPFWGEHRYRVLPPSPYFSYVHELGHEPRTSLEQVTRTVSETLTLALIVTPTLV